MKVREAVAAAKGHIQELFADEPPAEIDVAVEAYRSLVADAEAVADNVAEVPGGYSLLRQSILKAAFEGRLVPQDPADEPASVLLARLRERPEAALVGGHRGRRRRQVPQSTLPGFTGGACPGQLRP